MNILIKHRDWKVIDRDTLVDTLEFLYPGGVQLPYAYSDDIVDHVLAKRQLPRSSSGEVKNSLVPVLKYLDEKRLYGVDRNGDSPDKFILTWL